MKVKTFSSYISHKVLVQNNNQIEWVGKCLHLSYFIIMGGSEKILKTKNAAEAISGHLAVYIHV